LNKVVVPDFGGVCSTELLVFPQQPHLDSRFLMHFLSLPATVRFAHHNSSGVQLPRVSFDALSKWEMPVPPLAEQRRIIERLEIMEQRLAISDVHLTAAARAVECAKRSLSRSACSGELTSEWREEHPTESAEDLIARLSRSRMRRPLQLRTDLEMPELPDTWRWANLRFLADPNEAFCYGVVQPGQNDPDGVPLVRAGDLHDLERAMNTLRRVPRTVDAAHSRSRLRGGEVLITVVGANIGVCTLAPTRAKGFNIARAVAKIPVREVEPEFVLIWLESSIPQRWMASDAREVARPTLNIEQLETLPIPVPPVEEQREICRMVHQSVRYLRIATASLETAALVTSNVRSAILARAFSGELVATEIELARAEQRDYESGKQLLDRISRERSASVTSSLTGPRSSPPSRSRSVHRATRSGPSRRTQAAARAR
jgi:type I restriction enzyme S subunit